MFLIHKPNPRFKVCPREQSCHCLFTSYCFCTWSCASHNPTQSWRRPDLQRIIKGPHLEFQGEEEEEAILGSPGATPSHTWLRDLAHITLCPAAWSCGSQPCSKRAAVSHMTFIGFHHKTFTPHTSLGTEKAEEEQTSWVCIRKFWKEAGRLASAPGGSRDCGSWPL